jgi:hypothetical protein
VPTFRLAATVQSGDVIVDNIPPSLPPALSQDELFDQADLVCEGKIARINWSTDKEVPHTAFFHTDKILKGEPRYRNTLLAKLRLNRSVVVKMRRIQRDANGKPLAGQWSDGYRIGDHVRTHLVWDDNMGGYRTLWWNAVWQTPRTS